eukprot:CAMPEP_0172516966 /NCGR_PEP_ID=MMETSP1066-20121228/280543_1 /TAXON_ID=671091 /ORGANISM="Coscinodiscus wailesii, Strain CCMP2513" /LENGTH=57 /DNA_ID=CAMNT_0013298679 /DNA_START=53 /DNA_END=223 /DNA_ORIENTATION=+
MPSELSSEQRVRLTVRATDLKKMARISQSFAVITQVSDSASHVVLGQTEVLSMVDPV